MSPPRVPGTPNGAGRQISLNVPGIELGNCQLQIGPHPNNPQLKCITVGPLMLMIPLSDEARKQVVKGLSGIEIVSANEVPSAQT